MCEFFKIQIPLPRGNSPRLGITAVTEQDLAGQGRAALSNKFYSISHQEQNRVKDIIWNILNPACTRTIALRTRTIALCIRTYITLCTRTIALCLFMFVYLIKILTKTKLL